MRQKIDYWENELKASPFVLNIIKNGYTLPFENGEFPPPFFAKNNASALKHKAFVEKSIKELLENKCIKEV